MLSSLQAGYTGLHAHQVYLDVIGNNLANTSTPGFKSSRITFADLFSNTTRNATRPTSSIGGKNAHQVGTGVLVGTIDMNMNQGPVLTTGRPFDLGIQGDGFFVLSKDNQNFYTRSGTFGLDGDQKLVDLATGMRVQTGTLQDIRVDTTATIPPTPTTEISLAGTLPALITGPLAEVVTSTAIMLEGTAAEVTGDDGPYALTDGDVMSIRINGGASQEIEFDATEFASVTGGDLTNATAAEVAVYMNNLDLSGFTASADGDALVLTTENTGQGATLDIDNEDGTPATDMGLTLSMVTGTQTPADEETLLNDLVVNKADYSDGDIISISGTDATGLVVSADFTYGSSDDGTTLGDLRDKISTTFTSATATISDDGNIVVTADDAGSANMSLFIDDDDDADGTTLWPNFSITTDGADEDTAVTSVSIFDSQGLNHTLVLTFTRANSLRWDVTAGIPDEDGATVTSNISSIEFNSDGSFNAILGSGNSIEIYFAGVNATQSVYFDFGSQSGYDGMTQVGDESSLQVAGQDGYAAGSISTMSVEPDGQILGHYTNGQFKTLGQIGIASFANASGLEKRGDSLFQVTPNSGSAILGTPETGGSGTIMSGSLEQSNVDIGQEFVSLIEAQRGFQANAKIITTSDEILETW